MPRRFKSTEQFLKPDPKYQNMVIAKFINCLMWDGKKTTAQSAFYRALDQLKKKFKEEDELEVFNKAIENTKPIIEVRSKRVGGATYQVPMQVNATRQQALAFRWILAAARGRKGRPIHLKLADEFAAAYNGEGEAMNKREQVHRMAEANKAFAHFAW